MAGLFIAYHNTKELFGFEYVSREDIVCFFFSVSFSTKMSTTGYCLSRLEMWSNDWGLRDSSLRSTVYKRFEIKDALLKIGTEMGNRSNMVT